MRKLGVLAVLGACGGHSSPPPDAGSVALVLDIPNGALDPQGYSSVEIVLHDPSGVDSTRTATVDGKNHFEIGTIEPTTGVSVEATLRNNTGAAVGYGRTATGAAFASGAQVVVPVRRPIAYIAGTVSRDADGDAQTQGDHWTEAPATFSDLSSGAILDGKTQVGPPLVMMVAAGPSLYMITQAIRDPDGALIGPAKLAPVSTADHTAGTPMPAALTGSVLDGAGSDDGSALVIGTSTQLYVVDTAQGTARALTDGAFARVAIVTTDSGEVAVAIKNRGMTTGPCSTAAELWWAPLAGGAAHKVATGGFSDVATDRGHAYYVDACSGQLGELTANATQVVRTIAGKPTALAVSNHQAYIGVETQPTTTSLLVASVDPAAASDPPRVLWNEAAQQVVTAIPFPGVQRQLDASSIVFDHLEVGAGGDYVALTTSARFHGAAVPDANFPDIRMDAEELRVFDAATGGVVQRYRSWCSGSVLSLSSDIGPWACASTAGQTAPPRMSNLDHHINSMTFQFGKK
jgi:hypothetical protein